MPDADEDKAIQAVIDRLAERFPDQDPDRIAAVVSEAHAKLAGNPVRDYVPVLVEHDARDRLQAEGAHPVTVSDAGAPAAGPMIRAGQVPDRNHLQCSNNRPQWRPWGRQLIVETDRF